MIDPTVLDDGLLILALENAICDRQRAVFCNSTCQDIERFDNQVGKIRTELVKRLKNQPEP